LAGVAILIAIAECGQFIVLGPLVAESRRRMHPKAALPLRPCP
jgi:hypothetical protein